MKKYFVVIGILVIVCSLFTGPLGMLASLTGLGVLPLWLGMILLVLWVIALISLKQILNVKYNFFKCNKFLYVYLGLNIANYLLMTFYRGYLVSIPFVEYPGVLIGVLTPISALLFYISVLKVKNIWVSIFGAIGIFLSTLGIINQGANFFLVSSVENVKYIKTFTIWNTISNALVSLVKMVQNWFLGGILIGAGLSKKKTRK